MECGSPPYAKETLRASLIPHSRASPTDLPSVAPDTRPARHRAGRRCKGNMPNYWFKPETVTFEFGGRPMTIETGRLAKQAAGAALVTYGETVVLVTATHADPRPGIDFFPLTVDYVEKTSAAGKIPGRLLQARGAPLGSRGARLALHRPLDPPAVRGRLPRRDADHRDRALGRRREHAGHPGVHRRLGGARDLGDPVPRPDRRRAHRAATAIAGSSTRRPRRATASDIDLVVARQPRRARDGRGRREAGARAARSWTGSSARTRRSSPRSTASRSSRRKVGKPKIAVPPPRRHAATSTRACARRPRRGSRQAVQIRAKHERYAAIAEVEKEVVERLRHRVPRGAGAARHARGDREAPGRAARALGRREGRSCTTCAPS